MYLKNKYKASQLGFTLIELLVTITIMMLMLGGGLVAYVNFNEKQTVVSSVKTVQTALRSAQIKAKNGEKPPGCGILDAYQIYIGANTNEILIRPICDGTVQPTYDSVFFTDGVAASSTVDMRFKILTSGVDGAGEITLARNDYVYTFSVTQTGEISQGDWE